MQIGTSKTVVVLTGQDTVVPDMATLPDPMVEVEIVPDTVEVQPCSSSPVSA